MESTTAISTSRLPRDELKASGYGKPTRELVEKSRENKESGRHRDPPDCEIGSLQSSDFGNSELINLESQYSKSTKVNNNSCDGYDCNREATTELEVTAGEFGIINLNLCGSCKPKFKQSVVRENKGK